MKWEHPKISRPNLQNVTRNKSVIEEKNWICRGLIIGLDAERTVARRDTVTLNLYHGQFKEWYSWRIFSVWWIKVILLIIFEKQRPFSEIFFSPSFIKRPLHDHSRLWAQFLFRLITQAHFCFLFLPLGLAGPNKTSESYEWINHNNEHAQHKMLCHKKRKGHPADDTL